ncbi:hypothetical protein OLEAN_C17260 [Oleispira antarctica RB-8]|uniref:Uncharacterized protein n=1 Tax=Oleispira antarctica RB-8 TaxID=698738 RepID=R4YM53_OLEAN|nr:hypothetical protein OLEAN_C17260 [Oleispira antarctica RB-8]
MRPLVYELLSIIILLDQFEDPLWLLSKSRASSVACPSRPSVFLTNVAFIIIVPSVNPNLVHITAELYR